jgi:hypothetical protein
MRRTVAQGVLAGVVAWALVACGDASGGLARTRVDVSTLPTSYSMVLHADCGERQLLGTFRLVVRDGRVVHAAPVRLVRRLGLRLSDFPTLAGLVHKAGHAEEGADVDLRIDRSGLPTSLRIDHDPRAMDDEECYYVTRVRRLRH